MNNKQQLVIILALLVTFGNALAITPTLDVALAQDQNPPTTGKTTQNVTSTFGPNLPPTSNMTAGGGGSETQNTQTK